MFTGGSVGRSSGGASSSADIAAWVEADYASTQVAGVTLYDLSQPID